MKSYFFKAAGTVAIFTLAAISGFAQEDSKESTNNARRSEDVIIIRPKATGDSKFTVEIKGDKVTINGKPLAEFKNADITVTHNRRSLQRHNAEELALNDQRAEYSQDDAAKELAELDALRPPRPPLPPNRFRGGSTVYGYGNSNNLTQAYSTSSNKAFLGVGTEKAAEGVTVLNVSGGSPAEKAGLKEGDIITKINDTKIGSPEELTKTIGKFNPDEKITVTYKRDGKQQVATVVVTKRKITTFKLNGQLNGQNLQPFSMDYNDLYNFSWGKPKLGLKAQETEDGKGLKVLDVDDESAADKAGIKEGDTITSFDGTEVNNIEKLRELAEPALAKKHFNISLIRDGKAMEIDVKIPQNLKTTK